MSIAVEDPSYLDLEINKAFGHGADFVEIRFDFIQPGNIEKAIETVGAYKDRAVFTLRSNKQGGKFSGTEQERISWINQLVSVKPMIMDVEFDTIINNDTFADYLEKQSTPLLVSWHDFKYTPPQEELIELLSQMRIFSNNLKIVTSAEKIEDAIRVLDLYERADNLNLIAFSMGEAGIISRILCNVIGNAPFTYASLEKSIAPGQLTVKQMRRLYDRMSTNLNKANVSGI